MKKIYLIPFLISVFFAGFSQNAKVTTFVNSFYADVDDAMAFDSQGNLYGSNFNGTTVYKIFKQGYVFPFVTGLKNPNGIAVDSQDNVYVVEYSGGAIHKYSSFGRLLDTFPIEGFPSGMIYDSKNDRVIFTVVSFQKPEENAINALLPDGTIEQIYKGNPLLVPVGLAYDSSGNLYVGNYIGREIYRLKSNSDTMEYIATVPAPNNEIPYLAFITYARGNLYGTVYGEHKIYKINPSKVDDVMLFSGSVNGSDDGDVSEATYSYPAGIITDKFNSALYVSEYSGVGNIRKITFNDSYEENDKSLDFKLFPNPTSSKFITIHSNSLELGNVKIEITDFSGRLLYKDGQNIVSATSNFSKHISLNDFKKGIYIVTIFNNGITTTKSLLVE